MSVFRYSWKGGVTPEQLGSQIPMGLTATINGYSPFYLDLEVLPDPVSIDAKADLDECMLSQGWEFLEENPGDTITETVIVQDFDAQLTVDASSTANLPNWGDLLVVPLVVGGDGDRDVKMSATITASGTGAKDAIVRVVLRDGGVDTVIGIPGRIVSGGSQPIGNSAINGRLTNVAAGNYDVVVQGSVSSASIEINAASSPINQGLNINIQEILKSG